MRCLSLTLVLAAILLVSACGGEAARPVAITPKANGKIAFVASSASSPKNEDIYVMNADGSGKRKLISSPFVDTNPAWSPDGRKIAFARERGGYTDVYIANADGSGVKDVTKLPGDEGFPTWSPDGKKVAFESLGKGDLGEYTISAVNAEGTGATTLFERGGALIGNPHWSPDGTKILFELDSGGYVGTDTMIMNADGNHLTQLTDGYGDYFNARWAPDGKTIALVNSDCPSGYEPCVSSDAEEGDISLIASNGAYLRRLVHANRAVAGLAWAPDGTKIAYSLFGGSIYVMNADGTNREVIAERSAESPLSLERPFLSWQPLSR